MDETPQQGVASKCRGCGGRVPAPSRVTHFPKRFCGEGCRLRWSARRWRADALIVRRYFFHFLQFHQHPDVKIAGHTRAPCADERGHADFLDALRFRCQNKRAANNCPDFGPDDAPITGTPLPMTVELAPSLRDSLAALEDQDPELRRVIAGEWDTPRGLAQRMFTNARALVEMCLQRGKCVELQRDARVERRRKTPKEARQPITPDYAPKPRTRNDGADDDDDDGAPDTTPPRVDTAPRVTPKYAPLETVIPPDEIIDMS